MSRKASARSAPDPVAGPKAGSAVKASALDGRDICAVGTLIVVWAAYFLPVLTSKKLFFGDDMVSGYYLIYDYVRRGFETWGQVPVWANEVFCGNPLLPFVWGSLYPLNWLFLVVPAQIGFNLFLPLHNLLAALFAYALIRSFRIRPWPALVGALGYQFSGRLITLMQQPRLLGPTAYLPALLLAAVWILRTGRWRWVIFGAAMFALQFYLVNPQIQYYSAIIVGSYVVYVLVRSGIRDRDWRRIGDSAFKFAVGFALFAALVAPQLAEMLTYSEMSSRGGEKDWEFASSFSYPPEEIASLFTKSPFGEWLNSDDFFEKPWKTDLYGYGRYGFTSHGEYLGVVVLLLAFAGVVARGRPREEHGGMPVVFLVCLAVGGFLFALGRYGPLLRPLFHLLPGIARFRVPVRMLIGTELAVALLSARGAAWIADAAVRRAGVDLRTAGRRVAAAASILAAIGAAIFLAFHLNPRGIETFFRIAPPRAWLAGDFGQRVNQDVWRVLAQVRWILLQYVAVLAAATAAALFAIRSRRPRLRYALFAVLPVLIVVDQGSFGRRFQHRIPVENSYFDLSGAPGFLAAQPGQFRILPVVGITRFLPNLPYLAGVESLTGYHAVTLRPIQEILELRGRKPILDMTNVEYLLLDRPLAAETGLEEAAVFDDLRVYRNPSALPRAFLVDRARVIPEPTARLQYLGGATFDPSTEVVLETALDPAPQPGDGSPGTVEPLEYGRDEIRTRVDARRRCLMFASDAWYPDWTAEVDGAATPILRANHAFRAIAIPAGTHDVVFRYRPRGYRRWTPVAIVAWCVALVGAGLDILHGRRRPGVFP